MGRLRLDRIVTFVHPDPTIWRGSTDSSQYTRALLLAKLRQYFKANQSRLLMED